MPTSLSPCLPDSLPVTCLSTCNCLTACLSVNIAVCHFTYLPAIMLACLTAWWPLYQLVYISAYLLASHYGASSLPSCLPAYQHVYLISCMYAFLLDGIPACQYTCLFVFLPDDILANWLFCSASCFSSCMLSCLHVCISACVFALLCAYVEFSVRP